MTSSLKKWDARGLICDRHKTVGLVTLEDLLEELVGEIYDEDEDIDQKLLEEQIALEDLPDTPDEEITEEEVTA